MIVAGNAAGRVMLFDARQKIAEAQLHGGVDALLVQADGIIAATNDGEITRLTRDKLTVAKQAFYEKEPFVAITSCTFAGAPALAFATAEGRISIIDPATLEERVSLEQRGATMVAIAGIGDEVLYATATGELRRLATDPLGPPRTAYYASNDPIAQMIVTQGRACVLTDAGQLLVYTIADDGEPPNEHSRGHVCLGPFDDDSALLVSADGELRRLFVASLGSEPSGQCAEKNVRIAAAKNGLIAVGNESDLAVYRAAVPRVQRLFTHKIAATALAML